VLPDLPYVRKDVPGGSEAIRFARLGRSRALPVQPVPSDARVPDVPVSTGWTLDAGIRRLAAVLIVPILGLALLAPYAAADDLTDRRDRVRQQLAKTRADLTESSEELSAAAQAVDRAETQLADAQTRLAGTRQELIEARSEDIRMAGNLRQAQADLAAARARVLQGQRNLDAELATAGNLVRDQYQQQSNLLPLAVLVDASSHADLQTRLQWSTTMFDSTQAEIDRLTRLQQQLTAEKARQAALKAQVKVDRRAAAATLRTKQLLETRAAMEEETVEGLLGQRQSIERAAADDVAEDKAQYTRLTQEREAVEERIAIRIAQAKAAAARKAAAERAARKAAAERAAKIAEQRADAAERARRKAEQRGQKAPSTAQDREERARKSNSATPKEKKAIKKRSRARSTTASADHGFSFPVVAPITSPFGMRFHPVLRYWKLHDGTDFGAGCGTPIRAPDSGRVAEKYYNAGYGYRLMIDHGFESGRFVTTGYNHASRYTVRVGQRVRKGQVIGYVGSTGYSTGCHLHLMVWLNGRVVNPMIWF
jgi:murein DD-endopeptidase MepM/ murein hydrolase activator NlpD